MKSGYYGTLGVHLGCSDAMVRAAWSTLRVEKHPDHLMHQPNFDEAKVNQEFLELTEAYQQLKSIRGREVHRKWMEMFAVKCVDCSGRGTFVKLSGARRICDTCKGAGFVDRQ